MICSPLLSINMERTRGSLSRKSRLPGPLCQVPCQDWRADGRQLDLAHPSRRASRAGGTRHTQLAKTRRDPDFLGLRWSFRQVGVFLNEGHPSSSPCKPPENRPTGTRHFPRWLPAIRFLTFSGFELAVGFPCDPQVFDLQGIPRQLGEPS